MEHFTPLSAAVGGILIGLASTLLWAVNGRTAGISNIAGQIFPFRPGDTLWKLLFLVGLPARRLDRLRRCALDLLRGAGDRARSSKARRCLWSSPAFSSGSARGSVAAAPPATAYAASPGFSLRSVVAVATFMVTAHGHRLYREARRLMNRTPLALLSALVSGTVFGIGLSIARMTDPQKIKDFLDIAAIPDRRLGSEPRLRHGRRPSRRHLRPPARPSDPQAGGRAGLHQDPSRPDRHAPRRRRRPVRRRLGPVWLLPGPGHRQPRPRAAATC